MPTRRSRALLAALLALAPAAAAAGEAAPRRRALVIGIDGLTGEELHRRVWRDGAAPALRALMERGVFAPCETHDDPRCARTHGGPRHGEDYRWKTASGWAAVLSGLDASRHRVKGNAFEEQAPFAAVTRDHPTFLKRLKDRGYVTAAGGVGAFLTSRDGGGVDEGVLDFECGVERGALRVAVDATSSCNLHHRRADDLASDRRDEDLLDWLLGLIDAGQADVLMGVFDEVDAAGHRHGFADRAPYLEAISAVDALIGEITARLQARAARHGERWLVVVTSDHGGHRTWYGGGAHDRRRLEDEVVPFVVATYGDATPLAALVAPVRQMDVHPTVLAWFGEAPGAVDGRAQGVRATDAVPAREP